MPHPTTPTEPAGCGARRPIIEFPSRAAAEDWYNSAEYRKVVSLRLKSSAGDLIIANGFADQ